MAKRQKMNEKILNHWRDGMRDAAALIYRGLAAGLTHEKAFEALEKTIARWKKEKP